MFEDITPDTIKEEILQEMPNLDTREGSYISDLISPTSLQMWKLYDSMNALIPIAFVDETSGEYIDKRANEYGLYRKDGTKAQVELTFTGENGTEIQKGSIFSTSLGLEFVTLEDADIGESGTASVMSEALEIGTKYNVMANSIVETYQEVPGLQSVTNTAEAQGGTDQETDEALFLRLQQFLQRPATSGNAYHYEMWALEVDGIGGVKVMPLKDGPGTVEVIVVGHDKKPVTKPIVDNCKQHIEEVRPIGATVTVKSAEAKNINVSATLTLTGNVEISSIKAAFSEKLEEYLQSIAFERSELFYNTIGAMLMNTDGVLNYENLLVNGGQSNVSFEEVEVPVMGEVNLI